MYKDVSKNISIYELISLVHIPEVNKIIESALLFFSVELWWIDSFFLEGFVHPLVSSVLAWFSGLDSDRMDAELDPPYGQPREPA